MLDCLTVFSIRDAYQLKQDCDNRNVPFLGFPVIRDAYQLKQDCDPMDIVVVFPTYIRDAYQLKQDCDFFSQYTSSCWSQSEMHTS